MRSQVEELAPATLADTSSTAAVVARAEAMAGSGWGGGECQRLAAAAMTGSICARDRRGSGWRRGFVAVWVWRGVDDGSVDGSCSSRSCSRIVARLVRAPRLDLRRRRQRRNT